MLSRLLRTVAERGLMNPGDHVLVAVSGGPDSLALLYGLLRVKARLRVTLAAATVDHGLRPEAAGEAQAVARRCADLGVACEVLTVDVAAQRGRHVSLQDAARRARLAALQASALAHGCARIALGHTADDQAETILFRIVRGTGVHGLAGIPYRRGDFVRPLLDVRRKQVLAYLDKRGVAFVDDAANRDPRHTRSRVRHQWLPYLARENPRIVDALLALADDAATQREPRGRDVGATLPALGRETRKTLKRLVSKGHGTHVLNVPSGVVQVVYGQATFQAHGKNVTPLGSGALPVRGQPRDRLAQGATQTSPAEVALVLGRAVHWPFAGGAQDAPGGGSAVVSTGQGMPTEISATMSTEIEAVMVQGPGGPPRGRATFAAEELREGMRTGWHVRRLLPGDRMRPRGGRGSRKLQDLLVDAKVPRALRAHLPVVTDAFGVILYVPGLRPSEHRRAPGDAERWIEIRVR